MVDSDLNARDVGRSLRFTFGGADRAWQNVKVSVQQEYIGTTKWEVATLLRLSHGRIVKGFSRHVVFRRS